MVCYFHTLRDNVCSNIYKFLILSGTAHCANMYEPKDSDFPQLKQARNTIREFLRALIAEDDLSL